MICGITFEDWVAKFGKGVTDLGFWCSCHSSEEQECHPLSLESNFRESICKRWSDVELNDDEKEVGEI